MISSKNIMVSGINLSYGERILFENTQMQINFGEVVQVVGANGSGKTSLLRLLSRDKSFTQGNFEISSQSIFFQLLDGNLTMINELTLLEGLEFFASLVLNNKHLRSFDYSNYVDCYPSFIPQSLFATPIKNMSKGEVQKAKFLFSLIDESPNTIILLDEPFNALDADSVALAERFLVERVRKTMQAVMLVSHHRILTKRFYRIEKRGLNECFV